MEHISSVPWPTTSNECSSITLKDFEFQAINVLVTQPHLLQLKKKKSVIKNSEKVSLPLLYEVLETGILDFIVIVLQNYKSHFSIKEKWKFTFSPTF